MISLVDGVILVCALFVFGSIGLYQEVMKLYRENQLLRLEIHKLNRKD